VTRGQRAGVTLPELVVAVVCTVILSLPVLRILQGGMAGSARGMRKAEGAALADRILRIIHADLQASVFLRPTRPGRFDPALVPLVTSEAVVTASFPESVMVVEQGRFSDRSWTFLSGTAGAAEPQPMVSRIQYRFQVSPQAVGPRKFFRLLREEVLPPGHPDRATVPGGRRCRVLTTAARDFEIRPFAPPVGMPVQVFWVRLALYEAPDLGEEALAALLAKGSAVPVTEFLDVVSSDYLQACMSTVGYRPIRLVQEFLRDPGSP